MVQMEERLARLDAYADIGMSVVAVERFLRARGDLELRYVNGVFTIFQNGEDMCWSIGARDVEPNAEDWIRVLAALSTAVPA